MRTGSDVIGDAMASGAGDGAGAGARDAALRASRNVPVRHRHKGPRPKEEREGALGLQTYHSMPEYLQDNEFITRFYRPAGVPFRRTLLSLFDIHNETGNVWSHLIGAHGAGGDRAGSTGVLGRRGGR